jgi:fructose-1,6-bisphosphatase/inositol monophosphatase family enzyme
MIEGARIEHCYDDQYISSGGQLALLALGHYTMVADLRPWLLDPKGHVTQCAKPYDVSGAILCAQEAGCEVTDLKGGPLNMPLDTQTPVGFLAFAGPRTKERLLPHLREATSGLGGA